MPTPVQPARSLWRRVALALVGLLIALPASLAVAGVANAEPNYPPHFNKITTSRSTVCKGGKVVVKAMYFQSFSTVSWQITHNSTVLNSGTVVANKKGRVMIKPTFNTPGLNMITVSGPAKKGGGTLTLTAKVHVTTKRCGVPSGSGGSSGAAVAGAVTDPGDPAGAGLPVTGAQVALLVLLAGGLLIGGGILLSASRRRT